MLNLNEGHVGDAVAYDNGHIQVQAIGTIVAIDNDLKAFGIRFNDASAFGKDDPRYIASKKGQTWWCKPSNITLIEETNMFPIGSRVKYTDENGDTIYGSVVLSPRHDEANKRFVYVNRKVDKDGVRSPAKGSSWVDVSKLSTVPVQADYDNKLIIIVNKATRKTILTDDMGRKVIAKCHPDDIFSAKKGVSVVMDRYFDGFADGDHIYSVEANGNIGEIVYNKSRTNSRLKLELERRLEYGNIFANKRNAEEAAKKVASVFCDNTRTLP